MSESRERVVLIVPCYNEAERLDGEAFNRMVDEDPALTLLFVDDGSRDATPDVLGRLADARPGRMLLHRLDRNQGKAEAVRQGLLHALDQGVDVVGYSDADLATPPDELARLLGIMRDSPACDVLVGSRVKLMGRDIDRRLSRHYLGRFFATAASMILRVAIYDTQCGAKLMRRTPALLHALGERFLSRWAFDVELLGRLLTGAPGIESLAPQRVREEPLLAWRDAPGSKLRGRHMVGAAVDMARIEMDLARRRRANRT